MDQRATLTVEGNADDEALTFGALQNANNFSKLLGIGRNTAAAVGNFLGTGAYTAEFLSIVILRSSKNDLNIYKIHGLPAEGYAGSAQSVEPARQSGLCRKALKQSSPAEGAS
jgi:hypothetical protein